jgi:hypothetical protein
MSTAGKGMSLELSYRTELRSESSAAELVRMLNRVDGVQGVTLTRVAGDEWAG